MADQAQHHPEKRKETPPPLGAIYESPPNLLDRLRDLNEKDPAFASWVLLRADELAMLMSDTTSNGLPELKERITQSLIEAYDIHTALIAREQIIHMLTS
jgi:hypothetical protein